MSQQAHSSLTRSCDGALLAAGLSDGTVRAYALHAGSPPAHVATCSTGGGSLVHASLPWPHAPSVLVTCSTDCSIRVFDLRVPGGKPSSRFSCRGREAACAAASPSAPGLAAGCEDGSVLLWDARVTSAGGGAQPAGVLEEAHAGAVTTVAWHPAHASTLLTGGVDGLVSVFDSNKSNDDEADDGALAASLPLGASVTRLGLCGAGGDKLWALTGTEEVSLWAWAEAERLGDHPQEGTRATAGAAAAASGCHALTTVDFCLGCHWDVNTNTLELLAGTQAGAAAAWRLAATPHGALSLTGPSATLLGGHCDIVRCAVVRQGAAFTGGEDGRLVVWAARQEDAGGVGEGAPGERRRSPGEGRYSPY